VFGAATTPAEPSDRPADSSSDSLPGEASCRTDAIGLAAATGGMAPTDARRADHTIARSPGNGRRSRPWGPPRIHHHGRSQL